MIRTITPSSRFWPHQVPESIALPRLQIMGTHPELLTKTDQLITVAGARLHDEASRITTEHLVQGLIVDHQQTLVTSSAIGINTTALHKAIDLGSPCIAVIPRSLRALAGWENLPLLDKIANNGLLVSAADPESTHPSRTLHMLSSRLMGTLSRATIITRSQLRSGANLVARTSQEHGRITAAIPSTDSDAEGTNMLITRGIARSVHDASDVMALIDRQAPST